MTAILLPPLVLRIYRGYRYDTETGLYYLQSRYYNPERGRFLNVDAIAGEIGNILSHNAFAYGINNPITNYDPDGFRAVMMDGARSPRSRKSSPAPKNTLSRAAQPQKKTAATVSPGNTSIRSAQKSTHGTYAPTKAEVQEAHKIVASSYRATKVVAQEWGIDWGLKKEIGYKKGYIGASGGVILTDDDYGIYGTVQLAIFSGELGVSKGDSFYFKPNLGLEGQYGPAFISLDLNKLAQKIGEYNIDIRFHYLR